MVEKKIALASDHAGFELKEEIEKFLLELGYSFDDFGVESPQPVGYSDYAKSVAGKVSGVHTKKGIIVCGSGVGMAIVANKFRSVRAFASQMIYTRP